MVFTVFSACPRFAVTCAFYMLFSKKSFHFSLVFGTFFHQKSMKKWFQEPTHKKINLRYYFSRFLVDFGDPWGSLGVTFFSKNRQKVVSRSDVAPFFRQLFLFGTPFSKKLCFFYLPRHPFCCHFGLFLFIS